MAEAGFTVATMCNLGRLEVSLPCRRGRTFHQMCRSVANEGVGRGAAEAAAVEVVGVGEIWSTMQRPINIYVFKHLFHLYFKFKQKHAPLYSCSTSRPSNLKTYCYLLQWQSEYLELNTPCLQLREHKTWYTSKVATEVIAKFMAYLWDLPACVKINTNTQYDTLRAYGEDNRKHHNYNADKDSEKA